MNIVEQAALDEAALAAAKEAEIVESYEAALAAAKEAEWPPVVSFFYCLLLLASAGLYLYLFAF